MTATQEERRKQISRILAAKRAADAEIGEELDALRKLINWERRERAQSDLMYSLQTYHPLSTGLSPFSEDHDRVVARIQDCAFTGGVFCEAVYRGFSKTTISQNAAMWLESHGHRRVIPLFGATDDDAKRNMQSIKLELETNDAWLEDFPEICYPIRRLQGRPQRCAAQTYHGEPTRMEWTGEMIVLPTIPWSKASGGVIVTRGLTAASRGLVFKKPDGANVRPDFFLIDDPQTDESAKSPTQVDNRLDIIKRTILRSGGHRKRLAGVLTGTVRAENDVLEQLMNPLLSPAWQFERIRMVRRWADEHGDHATAIVPEKLGPLWQKYADIRNSFDRDSLNDQKRAWREATAFYTEHRKDMDAGCIVSWEGCFDPEHEVSAIQHAYNILIDEKQDVFSTECQCEPPIAKESLGLLSVDEICRKVNGYNRGIVPKDAIYLTAFIDVQGELLYWAVVAWTADFTGYVVDYGAWPKQSRHYYALADAAPNISTIYKGGLEARLFAAIQDLAAHLLGREWPQDGGGVIKVSKCLIDANWGESRDTVYSACRQSPHAAILLPTHGKGIKASASPIHLWPKQEGEKRGANWVIRRSQKSPIPYGIYDTNFWKSFLHSRFCVPLGDSGCLSLFKAEPALHRMLADHIHAEYPVAVEVSGGGRKVNEFQERPNHPDNHGLDLLTGNCVAASMLGAALPSDRPKASKQRRSLREMAQQAKGT